MLQDVTSISAAPRRFFCTTPPLASNTLYTCDVAIEDRQAQQRLG